MKLHINVVVGFLLLPACACLAQEMELQAELLNRVGTETSRPGDPVSARVVRPQSLLGDTLEGKVGNSKAGNKMNGKAVLSLSFDTLKHGGQVIPLAAQVRSIANSKGRLNADEEGRVIRGSNNLPKAAAGTGVGGLIGGLAGGGKGAAIGAAAGALTSIVLIDIAAEGPNVRLDPGSRVTLTAKSRSGPALNSLSAAAASAPAPVPTAAAPVAAAPVAAAAPRPSEPVQQHAAPVPASSSSSGQPDLMAVKADFIPGEKAIFYDDFSDMAGDEPPPHWKVRGKTELRTGQDIRQLTLPEGGTELTANLKGLTKNFTMEADLKFENVGSAYATWCFLKEDRYKTVCLKLSALRVDGAVTAELVTGDPRDKAELAGRGTAKVDFNQPVRQALWVQNGRLRVYINGERIVDANQIALDPIASVRLDVGLDDTPKTAFGLRRVRFAESTPDFGSVISSTGRYVTHGILFDTDSDRIKPESAPVIKIVARACETNPNLRLLIEGHTDSTGDANHNLDLSQRRAEAVKAVLTSQFNVAPARLTTAGLGASKPIDSNDTPAGRAQNRRVEFARQ